MTEQNMHRVGRVLDGLYRLSPRLAAKVAVRIFTSPKRVACSPTEEEFINRAEPVDTDFDDALAGYRWGAQDAAPRVLLIHGWESNAGRWQPLGDRLLRKGCRVFAFDAPASGRSSGRTVPYNHYVAAALAFEGQHGPFDVYIGHSFGGGVVAQLASRVPVERRPARMAVMASFDETEHVFDRYQDMLKFSDRVRSVFDALLLASLGPGGKVRDYSNTAALEELSEVDGLVIHSRDDAISPYAEGQALHAAWPGAELLSFDNQGHALRGEPVLNALENFALKNNSKKHYRIEGVEE